MGRGAGRTPAQPGRRGRFLELVAAGRAGVRTTGPPAGGDPLCLAGCGAARGVSTGSGCPGAERGRSLFSNHQVLGCCFNGCVNCPPRGGGPASGHLGASDFPPAAALLPPLRALHVDTNPPPTPHILPGEGRPATRGHALRKPGTYIRTELYLPRNCFFTGRRRSGQVQRLLEAGSPGSGSCFPVFRGLGGGVSSRWLSQTARSRKAGRWAPRRAVLSGGREEGRRGPGTWTLLYSAPRLAPASRHGVAGFLRR